jgi:hypothetical protein
VNLKIIIIHFGKSVNANLWKVGSLRMPAKMGASSCTNTLIRLRMEDGSK